MGSPAALQIKPEIEASAACHGCGAQLKPRGLLWQGMHVCGDYRCERCVLEFWEDLPVGHATLAPHRVDSAFRLVSAEAPGASWLGEPLREALRRPDPAPVRLEVHRQRPVRRALVLNCFDFIYGHGVLKLLNAAAHLHDSDWDLVVIVPPALLWLVPEGVAETWVVHLPLSHARRYYPDLHRRIGAEMERFSEARLSRAWSHPAEWELERFTRVPRHDFSAREFRVTWIWREDRLWHSDRSLPARLAGSGFPALARGLQRRKVIEFLDRVRQEIPQARPTVAGPARGGTLPSWIEDRRSDPGGYAAAERALCRTYAESRLVIGVFGSHLLLPSGHAGMSIDLMPESWWTNLGQDILYAKRDAADADLRVSAFRHRYIPASADPALLAQMAAGMIRQDDWMRRRFTSEVG